MGSCHIAQGAQLRALWWPRGVGQASDGRSSKREEIICTLIIDFHCHTAETNDVGKQLCACVCVCVCVLTHVWFFATPWPVACQAPLSMEFFRQEYWSGLPFPSPEDLPDPGIKPVSLVSAALASRFLTTEPPGKPKATILQCGISILSAPLVACPSAQWMVSLRPVTTNRRLALILILVMISVSEGIWLRSWEASKVSLQPSSSTITGIYLECSESFQLIQNCDQDT